MRRLFLTLVVIAIAAVAVDLFYQQMTSALCGVCETGRPYSFIVADHVYEQLERIYQTYR